MELLLYREEDVTQAKVVGAVVTFAGRFLIDTDVLVLLVRLHELCEDEEPFEPVHKDVLDEVSALVLINPGTRPSTQPVPLMHVNSTKFAVVKL